MSSTIAYVCVVLDNDCMICFYGIQIKSLKNSYEQALDVLKGLEEPLAQAEMYVDQAKLKAEEAFMSQAQAVAEHRLNNLVEEENVAKDNSASEDEVSQVESIAQSMGRSQDSRVKAAIAAAAQQSSVQVAGEVARLSSLGQQSIHEGHLLLRESHGLRDHWERRYFVLQSSGFLTMLADEKEKNSSFLVSETGIQNHMVCLPGTCLISLCCVDSLT